MIKHKLSLKMVSEIFKSNKKYENARSFIPKLKPWTSQKKWIKHAHTRDHTIKHYDISLHHFGPEKRAFLKLMSKSGRKLEPKPPEY